MSRHHDDHLDLCAQRALGVLDDVGARRLDAHLTEGCSVCEAALADFATATLALASTPPRVHPGERLRDRVLTAVRSQPPSAATAISRTRRFSIAQVALAAASIALLATTVVLWQRVELLTNQRDASRVQLDQIARELQSSQRVEQLIASPHTQCFDLASTGGVDTTLAARGCFDRASGRAIVVFNAAAAVAGSDYELWVLHGDQPVSLGVVRADASGRAVAHFDSVGDPATVTAFAVSLEPAGGSTAAGPTGPVIRVAALGS